MSLRTVLMRLSLLLALAGVVILGACSNDETTTGLDGDTPVYTLTEDYWPLAVGNVWTYRRIESGTLSPDPNVNYFNPSLPAADTELSVTGTTDVGGTPALVLHANTLYREELNADSLHVLDLWVDAGANAIRMLGEDAVTALDSSAVFDEQLPYDWIRFGVNRWTAFEVDYSGEAMDVDYDGEETGKVVFSEALGFDYPRRIYSGAQQPGNIPYNPSDLDFDTYLDGASRVRLVGEVVGFTDAFYYADLGALADSVFPDLIGEGFTDMRTVRFSLEVELFLTNQRDPNAPPGSTSINETYVADLAYGLWARRDLGFISFAPGIGPVLIATYTDLDKVLQVGDPSQMQLQFQPDRMQYDILVDWDLP
ncbi:MAG: hypothetical protein JW819_09340 [Candidatus Krumholzibacteriota bacterium]|nr:hypothetical protein [Candidatus Krumholzibacteriota bacterium]